MKRVRDPNKIILCIIGALFQCLIEIHNLRFWKIHLDSLTKPHWELFKFTRQISDTNRRLSLTAYGLAHKLWQMDYIQYHSILPFDITTNYYSIILSLYTTGYTTGYNRKFIGRSIGGSSIKINQLCWSLQAWLICSLAQLDDLKSNPFIVLYDFIHLRTWLWFDGARLDDWQTLSNGKPFPTSTSFEDHYQSDNDVAQ